ncbi:autotransporter outer membrane beta-barrel domain-containing protein [Ochrobactrum sp. SFR4]|nr:autotransporter outer membrane beta-barrel domain-containing protein [Ochrobactrum sp. SFR4]
MTTPGDLSTVQGGSGIFVNTNGVLKGATDGVGIAAVNGLTGAIDITAAGAVTGGAGISAQNYGGTDLIVHTSAVTGTTNNGIIANNVGGTGKTMVTATGPVASLGGAGVGIGIQAVGGVSTFGGVSVHAADVSGLIGISSTNMGAGNNEVVVTGNIVADGGRGISLISNNAGAATEGTGTYVRADGSINATVEGIYVSNNGKGAGATGVNVIANGAVTSSGAAGIKVKTGIAATGGVVVQSNKGILGASSGIFVTNRGSGNTNITTNETVTATGNHYSASGFDPLGGQIVIDSAIYALAGTNTTSLTIEANDAVSGGAAGIFAVSQGTGPVAVKATGSVSASAGIGLGILNEGRSDTVVTTGAVTALSQDLSNAAAPPIGILIGNRTNAGHLTLTTNGVVRSAAGAIRAQNWSLNGNLSVTANDQIVSTLGIGIDALLGDPNGFITPSQAASGNIVISTHEDVIAASGGIGATNNGVGNVSITSYGKVSVKDAFDTNDPFGIGATGRGNISINTKGDIVAISGGIRAAGAAGLNGVGSTGTISIVAERNVSATGSSMSLAGGMPIAGIMTMAQGNISTADVTTFGIVTGTDVGIMAFDMTTAGVGATNINIKSGSVVQGNMEGVAGYSSVVSAMSINNAGTIRNLSVASSDIAIAAPEVMMFGQSLPANLIVTSIINAGLIQGTVDLAGSGNSFSNQIGGIWNTAGGTNWLSGDLVSGGDGEILNAGTIIAATPGATDALTTTFNGVGANSFDNAGLVTMQNNFAGDTTVINGHYGGQGGTVAIDTVLGDDGSITDQLIVNGDTSGSSRVQIFNAGGGGAPTVEGIRIIEVDGASNGTFSLLSDYKTKDGENAVVGGAYAYTLHKNGIATPVDGDWYLRSQIKPVDPVNPGIVVPIIPLEPSKPRYQAGAPVYEAYPQALLGLNGMSTLQQRIGNRTWAEAGNRIVAQGADPVGTPYAPAEEAGVAVEGNGVWGRIEGGYDRINCAQSTTGVDYRQDVFKMQAGIDGQLMENAGGVLIGGVTVHYVHGKTQTISVYDAFNGGGEISTDGYGFGGTLTWYGNNGFYLDTQGQATWYRSDLGYDGGNAGLGDGRKGFGYALSIESGQRIVIDPQWSVTPQAQLIYSRVTFDDFTDAFGSSVSLDKGDSLQGRLGITLDHQTSWQNANGQMDRAHVYGIANLYYEFLEGTQVSVDNISFANQKDRVWGGVGVGGSYNWDNDKYSIYGKGLVNTSLNNPGDGYSLKGNIGFRVKW